MFSLSAAARRERELSGDARAGVWATGKARRAQRRVLRRNWRLLVGVFAMIAVPTLLAVPFVPGDFQRGLCVGVGLTAATAVVGYFVTQVTGTGSVMMGATAEQWTASELRPLRKHGWRLVNHVPLQTWDIDHVLVGPGGAWVVETKWSANPWKLEPADDRIREATRRQRRNASNLRLWQPFKVSAGCDVQAVVLLWGPTDDDRPDAPVVHRVDDVTVLTGVDGAAELRRRLLEQRGVLSEQQIERAWKALDGHVTRRDARDLVEAPVPPSAQRLYWRGMGGVSAAVVGFLTSVYSLQWIGRWLLWLVLVAVALAAGLALRDVALLRWPARGWLVGWSVSLLLVAGAVLNAVL